MTDKTTSDASWSVYIIQCGDGTLYTGITTDIARRLVQHQSGQGAKYTHGRGPLTLLYSESGHSRSSASKREIYIKTLSRTDKLQLCT